MTNRRSEPTHGAGGTPLSFPPGAGGYLTALLKAGFDLGPKGIDPETGYVEHDEPFGVLRSVTLDAACGGQVLPDCEQPAHGEHWCSRGGPAHKVHVCRCGVTWNLDGLTYAEWLAREWGPRV
jgi:hypothetical protein